ncbi:MAG: 3'-5' exonuclease [Bacteroidetes bacterium]|nr:3'-5' exonuclease [Bacteroidota bacterium]
MNFIAIDFETANRMRSSICSMGAAIVQNGKLVETLHFYIKPVPDYYDSYNTALHGISDIHTRHMGTFARQWPQLQQYFHNQTIVAHNAAFDCSVLRFTLDLENLSYPDLSYHCTYRLAQKMLPLAGFRLSDVSKYFGIPLHHHNAESDAKAAALIALRLCELNGIDSLDALAAGAGFNTGKIMRHERTYRPFSKR